MRRRISDSTMRLRLGVEALVAAGILHRLEGDAAHALVGERMAHDGADLVVVDAALDRADQGGRDAARLEVGQRLAADARQLGAAQVLQRVVVQRIELQIDLEARLEFGQRVDEGRVLGDADAVGVQHHVADRPAPRRVDDRRGSADGWWARRRRSAPGRARLRSRPGRRACARPRPGCGACSACGEESAKQTGQARLQASLISTMRQAGMLLVVGAEAAILGAAALGAGVRRQAAGRRASGIPACAASRPGRPTPGSSHAVLGAALGVVDAAVLLDDLGRHQAEAGLAQRGGLAEEEIGRGLTRYAIVHARPPLRIMTAAYRTRPRQTTVEEVERADHGCIRLEEFPHEALQRHTSRR